MIVVLSASIQSSFLMTEIIFEEISLITSKVGWNKIYEKDCQGGAILEQVCCINTENQYSGHGWNFEKTKKYIYHDIQMELEAGYFEHYLDTTFVKSVIELPVSYGCPSKCRFCASSSIHNFFPLREEQMMTLFEELYNAHYHTHENKTTAPSG